ncbi:MAG TPA: peptide ABC transporter substrate-binding protein [Gemmatimonadaceae bacterium]|nr:peptide ABC transporter substrate-binding protein [Gemmatimonadaceae bacterium]
MTVTQDASIVGLGLVLALGCSSAARPSDVVVFASGADLESANPLVTIHPLSRQVQRHVLFVTLVRYDSTLALEPYLARQWQWSDGRRELTMQLEPRLRWSDGQLTTARDVAYTLSAARDSRSGFVRASDLGIIDRVSVLSDSVIRISFRIAQRDLPTVFAELPILPAHLLERVPLSDMRRTPFNTHPVGNGPFRFVDRVPGQSWTFTKNPDFPDRLGGAPRIRDLVIAVVDEPTTKFAGLASGDLDFAGIAPTMAALARRDPTINVVDYPALFSTALVFNVRRSPFNDVRVRQAIGLSIDRQRIVVAALAGFGTPARGAGPPENPLALQFDSVRDVRRADSLLDAAGWRRRSNGSDGWRAKDDRQLTIELLTVGSGDNAIEQLVQADLADRGIRVEIRQLELAAFLARARAREKSFDMLITGIPGDLSLAYLRAMFQSSQANGTLDYGGFHAAELDVLFTKARDARTEAEVRAAWRDIQLQLQRLAPVVWLYHSRGVQGVAARMHHVVMDLRGELVSVARWTTTASPTVQSSMARHPRP